MNDCVPIATLTVARGRCRVTHICNISNRRFLVTWPTIRYWLSWLPLLTAWVPGGLTLRGLIERLCCPPALSVPPIEQRDVKLFEMRPTARPAEAARPIAPAAGVGVIRAEEKGHPFIELLTEALFSDRQVDGTALLLAALGATTKDGSPLVSDAALEYPAEAILMHKVVAPALGPLKPLARGAAAGVTDTGRLEAAIEELRKKVDLQDAEIKKLRKR